MLEGQPVSAAWAKAAAPTKASMPRMTAKCPTEMTGSKLVMKFWATWRWSSNGLKYKKREGVDVWKGEREGGTEEEGEGEGGLERVTARVRE